MEENSKGASSVAPSPDMEEPGGETSALQTTPLHIACSEDNFSEVEFLLSEYKKNHSKEAQLDNGQKIYNIQDCDGNTPVFLTGSSEIVELMLSYDDLAKKNKDGIPLLHNCAFKSIVTENIALKLCDQLGLKYFENLPLAYG